MTEENTPATEAEKAAGADELTSPDEHAETFDEIPEGADVSDERVPDDVEIAARSADMDTPSNTHEKQFVLGPGGVVSKSNPYTEANGYDHEPNKAATRQYMIDQGLWPTADVEFKSGKRHPDGVSWILTYRVEAIPANDAPDGSQTPRVVGSDGADVPEDAEPDSAVVLATGATNYSPPEDVEQHDDVTGDQTAGA